MKKVGSRTYEVTPADFPIQVEIIARNLSDNDAVPSALHIARPGSPVVSVPVSVKKPNKITRTYPIADPTGGKCTMVSAIACFFPPGSATTAKYDITITSAAADQETTLARVPSINPNMVVLTILYK